MGMVKGYNPVDKVDNLREVEEYNSLVVPVRLVVVQLMQQRNSNKDSLNSPSQTVVSFEMNLIDEANPHVSQTDLHY